MKKILLASTALVATTGFASAEIKFSGDASMGFKHDGTDWAAHYETTLMATLSGETDSGLSFGADLSLPYKKGSRVKYDTYGTAEEFTSATVGSSAVVYIEGGFGKLAFGEIDNGNAIVAVTGMPDIGWDGLGTDSLLEYVGAGSSANIAYIGTFADFTVAASYDIRDKESHKDWALGAEYVMGNYLMALGYGQISNIHNHIREHISFKDPENAMAFKLGADFGDFTIVGSYSRTTIVKGNSIDQVAKESVSGKTYISADIFVESFGMTAGYTMGDITVSGAYSKYVFGPHAMKGYGVDVAYDLGSSASLKASVGKVNNISVADLGISLTF